MSAATDRRVHVRWMIRRDMPTVLDIETAAFEFPWTEDDFIRCLRGRNTIGLVAEVDDLVMGYTIYELFDKRLDLLNIAVEPMFQRDGIGSAMVRKLIGKLSPQRRTRILTEVREGNLPAHQFFKAMGFRAVRVLRKFFDHVDEDAYLFQYRMKW